MGRNWFVWCCVGVMLIGLLGCQDSVGEVESPTAVPTLAAVSAPPDPTVASPSVAAAPTAEAAVDATAVPTAVPSPTPEPAPASLTVCMARPPDNLYLYGERSLQADALRHAVYENLYTQREFAYQAQGLIEIPSLENGAIQIETVSVPLGELVVDAAGNVVTLRANTLVSTAAGETVSAGENGVELPVITIRHRFQPLVWSDGTPVTADDSVFSFEVAGDDATFTSKRVLERTASYSAEADDSVVWRGLPGYQNPPLMETVWAPLPRHALGDFTPAQLLTLEVAQQRPLSSGPFVITRWSEAEITLEANPFYYREGLPLVDTLTFRFPMAEAPLTLLEDGSCDVITQDALAGVFTPGLNQTSATILTTPSVIVEQLSFGIVAAGRQASARPDWFGDVRVRQAFAHCLNREALVAEVTAGFGSVLDTFTLPEHPLLPPDVVSYGYDPALGNELLDAAGFLDGDGDGVREELGGGQPFTVTLITTNSEVRTAVATQLQTDMEACGIEIGLNYAPVSVVFGQGPSGPVFGRNFALAGFGWAASLDPACWLYTDAEIPGPENGWQGRNVTGWSNGAYDAACRTAESSLLGSEGYVSGHQTALRLYAEALPAIPLFSRVSVTAARPEVSGLAPNSSQPSEVWNIAEWTVE